MSDLPLRTIVWFLLCVVLYESVKASALPGNCTGVDDCENNGYCSSYEQNGSWFRACNCTAGYGGARCEFDDIIDRCDPNPCPSGELCDSNQTEFWCTNSSTDVLWGENCTESDLCANHTCYNNGTCIGNSTSGVQCVCELGYSGEHCQVINVLDMCIAFEPCQNNGTCISGIYDFTCICADGWNGMNCTDNALDYCQTYHPCQNNGTCSSIPDGYICSCTSTWFGDNCTDFTTTAVTSNTTTAASGTTSTSQPQLSPISCSNITCLNDGNCTLAVGSGPSCQCPLHYSGSYCEILEVLDVTANCSNFTCHNGGECIDNATEPYCACAEHFLGDHCEILEVMDYCHTHSNPCENNGTCVSYQWSHDYRCDCQVFWIGKNCTVKDYCYNYTCYHGGSCSLNETGGAHCHCPNGYSGAQCEIIDALDYCEVLQPCEHNSTCTTIAVGYSCSCLLGWTGTNCEIRDWCADFRCHHNGYCRPNGTSGAHCHCPTGFSGAHCEIVDALDYCDALQPCQNNGTCTTVTNGYTCSCHNIWYGNVCQFRVLDYCKTFEPCQNNGTCFALMEDYTCSCTDNWFGRNCTIAVTTTTTTTTVSTTTPEATSTTTPATTTITPLSITTPEATSTTTPATTTPTTTPTITATTPEATSTTTPATTTTTPLSITTPEATSTTTPATTTPTPTPTITATTPEATSTTTPATTTTTPLSITTPEATSTTTPATTTPTTTSTITATTPEATSTPTPATTTPTTIPTITATTPEATSTTTPATTTPTITVSTTTPEATSTTQATTTLTTASTTPLSTVTQERTNATTRATATPTTTVSTTTPEGTSAATPATATPSVTSSITFSNTIPETASSGVTTTTSSPVATTPTNTTSPAVSSIHTTPDTMVPISTTTKHSSTSSTLTSPYTTTSVANHTSPTYTTSKATNDATETSSTAVTTTSKTSTKSTTQSAAVATVLANTTTSKLSTTSSSTNSMSSGSFPPSTTTSIPATTSIYVSTIDTTSQTPDMTETITSASISISPNISITSVPSTSTVTTTTSITSPTATHTTTSSSAHSSSTSATTESFSSEIATGAGTGNSLSTTTSISTSTTPPYEASSTRFNVETVPTTSITTSATATTAVNTTISVNRIPDTTVSVSITTAAITPPTQQQPAGDEGLINNSTTHTTEQSLSTTQDQTTTTAPAVSTFTATTQPSTTTTTSEATTTTTTIPTTMTAPFSCPFTNYVPVCENQFAHQTCLCIYNPDSPNAWAHANETCRTYLNSYLPIIRSSNHWYKLNAVRNQVNVYRNWMGLMYDGTLQKWMWSDGSTFLPNAHYAPWAQGEPNLNSGTCVASANLTGTEFTWFMHDCADVNMQYVCFIPPPEYCNPYDIDYINNGGATNGTSLNNWVVEGTAVVHECMDGTVFKNGESTVTHLCKSDGNWTNEDFVCSAVIPTSPTSSTTTTLTTTSMTAVRDTTTGTLTTRNLTTHAATTTIPATTIAPFTCPFTNYVPVCKDRSAHQTCLCIYNPDSPNAWAHANETCRNYLNSYLPIIRSSNHWYKLNAVRNQVNVYRNWMGLMYDGTLQKWMWSDGSSFLPDAHYAPWAEGEPNLNTGTCVASTNLTGTEFKWFMHDCADVNMQYVCFIPPPEYCNPYDIDYINNGGATNGTSLNNWVVEGTAVVHECMDGTVFKNGESTVTHLCKSDGNWTNENFVCSVITSMSPTSTTTATSTATSMTDTATFTLTTTDVTTHAATSIPATTTAPFTCPFTNYVPVCKDKSAHQTCLCIYNPNSPNAWAHANETCRNYLNSYLPIIRSSNHWYKLNAVRSQVNVYRNWMGLMYDATLQKWMWSDGSTFLPDAHYAPWAQGEPNLSSGTCVASANLTGSEFTWFMHDCADVNMQYVCFIPPPEYCDPYAIDYINNGGVTNGTSLNNWVVEGTVVVHECMDGTVFKNGESTVTHLCKSDGNWTNEDYVCNVITSTLPTSTTTTSTTTSTTTEQTPTSKSFTTVDSTTTKTSSQLTAVEATTPSQTATPEIVTKKIKATTTSTTASANTRAPTTTTTTTTTAQATIITTIHAIVNNCSVLEVDMSNTKAITNITLASASALHWMSGVEVIHSCLDGYEMHTGGKIVTYQCENNGNWSNVNSYVCKEIPSTAPPPPSSCSPPKPPVNFSNADLNEAAKMLTDVKLTNTVLHKCNNGYELPDGSTATSYLCSGDGTWQNINYGVCAKVKCLPLYADYRHSTANTAASIAAAVESQYEFETTIVHECISGYAFPGGGTSMTYRCEAEKKWTGYNGAVCLELPTTAGVTVAPPTTAAPLFDCPEQYKLVGNWCVSALSFSEPYYSAESTCASMTKQLGGTGTAYLPKFPTESIWLDFKQEIEERKYDKVWIWARYDYRPDVEDKYLWGDRTKITWNVPWFGGKEPEPPAIDKQLCVYADRKFGYQWSIQECDADSAHFICIKSSSILTTEATIRGSRISTIPPTIVSTTEFDYYEEDEDYGYEDEETVTTKFPGCRPPKLDLHNVGNVTVTEAQKLKARYLPLNTTFIHQCIDGAAFRSNQTVVIYMCLSNGHWANYNRRDARCWLEGETTTTTTTAAPTTMPITTEDPEEARRRRLAQISAGNERFTPQELSETERAVATAVQSMGCIFLVASLATVLCLYIAFRSFGTESFIVFNQDFALLLGHILVLTLREPGMYAGGINPNVCLMAAVLMHFFFLAGYMFMLLEALQTMLIIGNVIPSGSLFTRRINAALGWGVPLTLVALSGPMIGDEYTTYWTCWGDLNRGLVWGLLFPMAVICAAAIVMVEAGGMLNRVNVPFPDHDPVQRASAFMSRGSLPFILILTVASHAIGMVAVFFQIVYLYGVCFFANILNAIAIVFFHTSMDSKIRTSVSDFLKKIIRCGRK